MITLSLSLSLSKPTHKNTAKKIPGPKNQPLEK